MNTHPPSLDPVQRIQAIYQGEVLARRHRRVKLAGRRYPPRLMQTFLGYELKLGKRRITCPDLVTARYLALFAELGMPAVALPYDPTVTSALMPALESAFEELRLNEAPPDRKASLLRRLKLSLLKLEERTEGNR